MEPIRVNLRFKACLLPQENPELRNHSFRFYELFSFEPQITQIIAD
ncbi:Uncharacterized protein dnm_066750 [Desulfonema magnum]|uniref:Uncharacterized protein n=1 Tax=Desulfonema magnum TaxID=45655 RepID=A0A975GR55_9BACT|nr:Uncharacterized protein dnm_066750 [Desulfonema magnum]